jgi:hypothetical protein
MKTWATRAGALALTALAASPAFAQGCAMCGTAVNSAKDPLAKGLALSILLMLAVPNLLIASIGGWLFFTYRRAGLARAAQLASAGAAGDGFPPAGEAPDAAAGSASGLGRHSNPGETT